MRLLVSLAVLLGIAAYASATAPNDPIRVGIIELDAHAVPVYSPDIPFSADNIEKSKRLMHEIGVELVDTILESVLQHARAQQP